MGCYFRVMKVTYLMTKQDSWKGHKSPLTKSQDQYKVKGYQGKIIINKQLIK